MCDLADSKRERARERRDGWFVPRSSSSPWQPPPPAPFPTTSTGSCPDRKKFASATTLKAESRSRVLDGKGRKRRAERTAEGGTERGSATRDKVAKKMPFHDPPAAATAAAAVLSLQATNPARQYRAGSQIYSGASARTDLTRHIRAAEALRRAIRDVKWRRASNLLLLLLFLLP